MGDEENSDKAPEALGEERQEKKQEETKKSSNLMLLLLVMLLVVLVGAGAYVYMMTTNKTVASVKKVEAEVENLRVGIIGDYTLEEVSALKNYDEHATLFRNVYSSLVAFGEDKQLVPDLATSWSNPDDKTWVFKLRKGVKFSDGKDFTANDVKYSLDTIQADPDSEYNEYFSEIAAVNVLNPDELEIKTEAPATYLLSKLTYLFVVQDGTKDTTFKNAVGTGPFVYNKTETQKGKQLVFDRNNGYWGGASKTKKVTFKIYDEEAMDQRLTDFGAGLLDVVDAQTTEELDKIKTVANTHQQFVTDLGIFFLYLNSTDDYLKENIVSPDGKNPMKDKRVRQAIWRALDTDALINDVMGSMALAANGMLPSGVYGYDAKVVRPKYDVKAAKTLMEEAGYKEGFKVTLPIVSVRENVGEFIKKSLSEINIEVTLDVFSVEDFGGYMRQAAGHKLGMMFSGWTEETKDGQNMLETVFGESSQNLSGYKSAEFDEMVAKMSGTTNQVERKGYIGTALAFLNEEVPSVPLYSKKIYVGVRDDLKWSLPYTGDYYFYDSAKLVEEAVVENPGFFQRILSAIGL